MLTHPLTRWSLLVLSLAIGSSVVLAQPPKRSPSKPSFTPKGLTNADIIKMSKAGLGEQIILTTLEQSDRKHLDTTPDGLVALKQAGVSDAVIAAVLGRPANPTAPAPAPVKVPEPGKSPPPVAAADPARVPPGIYIQIDGRTPLPLEPTVISRVRTKGAAASIMTLGIAKSELVAEVRGSRANIRTSAQQPTFVFSSIRKPVTLVVRPIRSSAGCPQLPVPTSSYSFRCTRNAIAGN